MGIQSWASCSLQLQVAEFLAGLVSVSKWESWRQGQDDKWLHTGHMLRPLVLNDFSDQLAGDLAPLNVLEWRRCTSARGFHYEHAHKVGACLTWTS